MSYNIVRTNVEADTIGYHLGTTAGTVVYTVVRPRYPVLDVINLANLTGAAVVATVAWYDTSASTAYTIFSGPVPASGRVAIADIYIKMQEGDQIRASAAAAVSVDMILTFSMPVGSNK